MTDPDTRPSITATPQFATPANEQLKIERDPHKMSIGGESTQTGIFTQSPGHKGFNSPKETNTAATVNFDMDNDPDRPHDAINSSVIIEEIDMNGHI